MARVLVPVIASFLLLASLPAQAQSCACADIAEIQLRMTEITTAINAFIAETQKMMEQITRTQQPLPYTKDRYEKLKKNVQVQLDALMAGKSSPTGPDPGGTNNLCMVTINLPETKACMHESIARHEAHHQKECMKTLGAGAVLDSISSGKNRFERDGMQLMDYAGEEIAAYAVELQFLQDELARLSAAPECNPKPPPAPRRAFTSQPRK